MGYVDGAWAEDQGAQAEALEVAAVGGVAGRRRLGVAGVVAEQALEGLLRHHASHPEPAAASYATDGGNLERLGLRSLIFGPGSIDVAHKADEYIGVAALERCVDVVEAIARARCYTS